jgi:hypothetical protein
MRTTLHAPQHPHPHPHMYSHTHPHRNLPPVPTHTPTCTPTHTPPPHTHTRFTCIITFTTPVTPTTPLCLHAHLPLIRAPFWWGLRAPTTLPALWALQPQPHCSAGLLLGHLGCLPAPPLPSSKPGPALSPPPGHQLKAQNKEPSCLQPYAPISRALPTPVSPSSDQQALNPLHHQQATGHQPITWQQPITRHQPTTQQRLVTHHQPITQQQPVTHH